jgi:hypothetical protein
MNHQIEREFTDRKPGPQVETQNLSRLNSSLLWTESENLSLVEAAGGF